jgi:hypothetical protein
VRVIPLKARGFGAGDTVKGQQLPSGHRQFVGSLTIAKPVGRDVSGELGENFRQLPFLAIQCA